MPAVFAGPARAERRFWEFFTAQISNDNTRKAYCNAVRTFFRLVLVAKDRRAPPGRAMRKVFRYYPAYQLALLLISACLPTACGTSSLARLPFTPSSIRVLRQES